MFSLAQEEIYSRYKTPQNAGHLTDPTFKVDGLNAVCGDEVHLEGRVEGETLTDLKHTCRACAICTAAADFLPELLIHKTVQEINAFSSTFLIEHLGIDLSPIRLKCALLPLETLRSGLLEQAQV